MKARILDPHVQAYSDIGANSVSTAILKEGMEVEFGAPVKKAGKVWVPIILSTGQKAFISGNSRLFIIREGTLTQEKVDLHSEPSPDSPIQQTLTRNTKFSRQQVIKGGGQDWVRIKLENGTEGFIDGETRIRLVQPKTKALGKKNIMTGVMWLLVGVVINFPGFSASAASTFTWIGYGAILFGAGMLIYGLVQYFTAPI